MKKWLCLLLALVMCMSFAACSDTASDVDVDIEDSVPDVEKPEKPDADADADAEEEPKEDAEKPEEPEEEPEADAIELESFILGDFNVEFVGAELFEDSDGENAIRVYYDFTNNSDETVYPSSEVYFDVVQNGHVLDTTYASYDEDVAEYGNKSLRIRPGCGIRCIAEYALDAEEGIVTMTISNWDDDEESTEFDPAALPGAPAKAYEIEPVDDPKWISTWSDTGVYDDDFAVTITEAEVGDDGYGNDMVRVYYEFTNNSDDKQSPSWATMIAFQDGVELKTTYPKTYTDEDDARTEDAAIGETVTAAKCFIVRTDSPIEVQFDSFGDCEVGAIFTFN